MPTVASMASADFHPMHHLDSPFVDITLNNCDDMSLYQHNKATSQQQMNKNACENQYSPLSHLQHLKPQQQQQQQQQACASSSASASSSYSFQNPAYLNSSMLSSSTSSSSNNSQHSAASSSSSSNSSSNSCPYTYQQSMLVNSSSNTNLNNLYQYPNQYAHQNTLAQQQKQFALSQDQNHIYPQQQQQLQQQDAYEVCFKKDEQLAEQMYRMQQLQEQMSSLAFSHRPQSGEIYSNTNTSSSSSSNSNQNVNNLLVATSNAISSLSNQIEDRKSYLMASYHQAPNQQMAKQGAPQQQNALMTPAQAISSSLSSQKIGNLLLKSSTVTAC